MMLVALRSHRSTRVLTIARTLRIIRAVDLAAMRALGPTQVQGRIRAQVLVLADLVLTLVQDLAAVLVLTQVRALAAVRELTPGRVPARTQVPARVLGQALEQVRAAALDRVRTTTNLTTRPKKKVSEVANQQPGRFRFPCQSKEMSQASTKSGQLMGRLAIIALLFLATPVSSVLKFPVLLSQPARDRMDITFVAFGKSGTNATDEFRELQIGWQSVRTRAKDSPLLVWDYYTGDNASSTCLGDSGAPLYYGTHRGKIGESRVLVGIVSSRQESCESGAGYSNLLDGTLRAWICDSTRTAWPYLCTRA